MKQLAWGLIGCGDIARRRVAPALRDLAQCDLVAVSRRRAEFAESFAREFGARNWHSTWQELILDDEIDAVYVATPVHLHATQTVAAAEAGKHVLCEKPMALNVRECDQMIAACRANNVKLGVAFFPVVARIKSIIDSGEIGAPVIAQINAFEWFNPEADHPRAWLIKKESSGGGPMFDFGCHRIEVLANIFGPIAEVTAIGTNVLFDREVEDTTTALFRFESGACGILSVTHAALEPRDTLDVFGSGGSIHVPVLNDGEMRIVGAKSERRESHLPATNLHAPLIEDFVKAVLTNREPAVSGKIGRAVATIEAEIYQKSCAESSQQTTT